MRAPVPPFCRLGEGTCHSPQLVGTAVHAALGEGSHLPISGCLVTWSSTHPLCYSRPRSLPGRAGGPASTTSLPLSDLLPCGPGAECGGLCAPRVARAWSGRPPAPHVLPTFPVPCSRFSKDALAVEAMCQGTAWFRDLPHDPPICFWKTGRVGDLPPLLPLRRLVLSNLMPI